VADVLVGQRVLHFAAAPRSTDHTGGPQHAQMLGDQRLGGAERLDELMHATGAHAQLGDDRDAQRGRERAQEFAGCAVLLGGVHLDLMIMIFKSWSTIR